MRENSLGTGTRRKLLFKDPIASPCAWLGEKGVVAQSPTDTIAECLLECGGVSIIDLKFQRATRTNKVNDTAWAWPKTAHTY